jgi:hypothetical protein
VRACGHDGGPRRVCDLCVDATAAPGARAEAPYVACSGACLERHRAEAHGDTSAATAPERAASYQARVNARSARDRALFAAHRARVAALVEAAGRGGSLCVLGAGNGSDLDVPALARAFTELHLVDLDGEALARGHAALPEALRARVTLHAGVDLTGLIDRIDAWGDAFPDEAGLARAALPAIQGTLARLGRRFDTVVSTCVLSQLVVPFHRALVLPAAAWESLRATLTAIHLSTIAGATRPGGTGILVFDVLSSKSAPGLRDLDGAAPEAVEAFAAAHRAGGGAPLEPDPAGLVRRLRSPGMERLVESPHLTTPWAWNIGAETQLVYGLVFRRP